jgi:hypothetical protein
MMSNLPAAIHGSAMELKPNTSQPPPLIVSARLLPVIVPLPQKPSITPPNQADLTEVQDVAILSA